MMEKIGSKKKGVSERGAGGRSSRGSASRSVDTTSRASSSTSVTTSQSTQQSEEFSGHSLDLAAITGGYDLRAHLRQILTFSDEEQGEGSSEDDFSLESYDEEDPENDVDDELQKLMANDRGAGGQPLTPKPTDQNNSQALVPITEEEDIDSEEEREIMKEIKNEITNNVRQEMKSELELYKAKMDKLNKDAGSKAEGENKDAQHTDLDNLDPKLREAIIKMRKLDKILMKRIRREKEVKRDRILLERRIRRELEGLHLEGKDEYKEVKSNEQKFLALELPARHNEETSLALYDPDTAATLPGVNQSENAENEMHNMNTERKEVFDNNNETAVTDRSLTDSGININEETGTETATDSHTLKDCRSRENIETAKVSSLRLLYKEVKVSGRNHYKDTVNENYDLSLKKASPFTACSSREDNNISDLKQRKEEILSNVDNKIDENQVKSAVLYSNEEDIIELKQCKSISHSTVLPPNAFDVHFDLTGLHRMEAAECWTTQTELIGVTVPDEFTGEEVFATQLNEDDYPGLHSHRHNKAKSRKGKGRSSRSDAGDDDASSQADDVESCGDSSSVASGSVHDKNKRRRKKDFIKRNKQLAADAGNLIAMTDEEKKRLDDLLLNVDTVPEIPEAPGLLDDDNPFQIAVKPGEGFVPEDEELRALTSIDSRLKDLMPPEDYESIASSSMSHVPKHKLFTHTGVKHAVDWEHRGERTLFQNAEQRELNERMAAIESELSKLHNPEEIELETPRLGEDQLHDLIDQCVTSLSHTSMSRLTLNSDSRTSFADTESVTSHATTIDNTPRSPRSARQEILDNPPRLAPEVLQKLLSEAYHPLSKQLSTLREAENEEEEGTPIPADVWKLISMEKVEENGVTEDSVVDDVNPEQISARNGFRVFSRTSTASSLASVSDLGRESRESQVVKLPEIDPSGTLVTQGLYNQQYVNNQRPDSFSSAHTPVNNARNSLSDSRISNSYTDSRMEIISIDGDIMSPHPPPPKEKREGSSGGKSRTVTPASRTNVT